MLRCAAAQHPRMIVLVYRSGAIDLIGPDAAVPTIAEILTVQIDPSIS